MKNFCAAKRRRLSFLGSTLAIIALIGCVEAARAAPPEQSDLDSLVTTLDAQKAKLEQQERLLKQQMRQLDAQKEALAKQQRQLDALRAQIGNGPPPAPAQPAAATVAVPLGPSTLGTLRGMGAGETAQAAPPQQPVGQAPAPPEHAPEVNVLSDRGGVLTPKGALVWEPAIDFSHSTNNQAIVSGFTVLPAILVGELDISQVNHDILQAVNTFRYGLTNRAEIEVRIPYVYGRQETTSRPLDTGSNADTVSTITGHNLGDVELAGHYQFNSGSGGWPYLIGNLRFKSRTGEDPFQVPLDQNGLPTRDPTGSGFYDLEPSLTAIYPSDPAVFFANVGYLYGFSRHVNSPLVTNNSAQVDPGGAIRFSFGLGFGVNESSSFSLGYDYSAFLRTKIDNSSVPGTDLQIGSVLIGYSYRFSDRFSTNVTTAIGVTRDAPDTEIIVRFPIKFQVFD